MNIIKQTTYFFTVLFAVICLFLLFPSHLQAADTPVSITSCKLNNSGSKVTVKAKIAQKNSSYGKKLYLLALDAQTSETKALKTTPLTSAKNKKGSVTFKVKYNSTMLYQKFALAYKKDGKYKIISNTYYITNPEVLATYTGSGPKTISKKGLQAENLEEGLELRTQHAVLNWTVNSLLTTNYTNTVPYEYRGKTYYFNGDMLAYNDAQVQGYNAGGAKVTIILLLPNSSNSQTDAMRFTSSSSAKYSSFKTSTKAGCRTFEALMSYLAKRYGTKENYVSGWILGNEVNTPGQWNYGGGKKLSTYMENYARAFRICYNAVRSVSKKSNVYISLDHNWNIDADNSGKQYFTAKAALDEFYKQINARGKIVFHIAYHAYPQGLVDPVFWDDSLATNSTSSKYVTFKNLTVLTNYVKKNFGKNYTIMLSEQSFNSTKGEAIQAAAYAYAYYMSEGNSMIEAFIYGRHFDNPVEMKDGCYWGLSDSSHNKRMIWHVFQNIDTAQSFKFTNQLVKYTNLKSWKKISGFKKTKYQKMPDINRTPTLGSVTMDTTNTAVLFWKKVDYIDGYEIYRNDQKIATIMDSTVLGYTDDELVSGETYTYKMRSFKYMPGTSNANEKAALFSSYSNALTITATTGIPEWNADDCSVNGKNITLSWKAQKDADGYEIFRTTSPGGNYTLLTDRTKTSYTDKNTVSGTTYYYKVRAYVTKDGQKFYGEFSDEINLQANIQLTAKIVDGKLALSWSAFPDAVKYQIYCSSDWDERFVKIKTIRDAAELTYVCTDYKTSEGTLSFAVGETYHFEVCAVLSDGNTSAYSNIADVLIEEELLSLDDDTPKSNETDETEIIETDTGETETTETDDIDTETIDTDDSKSTENANTETTETDDIDTETFDTDNSESTESQDTESTETETIDTETFDTDDSESTENGDTEAAETETTDTETFDTDVSESTENEDTETTETENIDTETIETDVSENTEAGELPGNQPLIPGRKSLP